MKLKIIILEQYLHLLISFSFWAITKMKVRFSPPNQIIKCTSFNLFTPSNAGVSRSTSIAMAYTMHKERLPLDKALERLRQTRPSVQPNEAFMKQLRQLEQKLGLSN